MCANLRSEIREPVARLQLVVEDSDTEEEHKHPRCLHGPTVLFYRRSPSDGYYACAAHRDSKLCSFGQKRDSGRRSKHSSLTAVVHDYPERVLQGNQGTSDPTNFLSALSQDKVHAQYFFDENALEFFAVQCRSLQIEKVICIGAPRLHFYLRKHMPNVRSFLLDFDERFAAYLSPDEFCWYNMCNNHFFYSRQPFEQFLQCPLKERLLIVTDPPFGCRTELIAYTLRSLRRLHNRINNLPNTPLAIFWVYPYYNANHIRHEMPELEMCDYKVNYKNHARYTNTGSSSRSYGSPVRIYTNAPMRYLVLRLDEGYRFCDKCQRYSAIENIHCDRCKTCPSQNGQTYKHCKLCDTCVKPNYVHCNNCRRCTQREGHQCDVYQLNQHCWICRARGHIETSCSFWLKRRNKCKKLNDCLICRRNGHRELRCPKRKKCIMDNEFMVM